MTFLRGMKLSNSANPSLSLSLPESEFVTACKPCLITLLLLLCELFGALESVEKEENDVVCCLDIGRSGCGVGVGVTLGLGEGMSTDIIGR